MMGRRIPEWVARDVLTKGGTFEEMESRLLEWADLEDDAYELVVEYIVPDEAVG